MGYSFESKTKLKVSFAYSQIFEYNIDTKKLSNSWNWQSNNNHIRICAFIFFHIISKQFQF